jgi:hypothetical protein
MEMDVVAGIGEVVEELPWVPVTVHPFSKIESH